MIKHSLSMFLSMLLATSSLAYSEANYIHPPKADYIDAPLPEMVSSEYVMGIYGNILYPQDRELMQQYRLFCWVDAYSKDPSTSFPLTTEDLNDISLYILNLFPLKALHHHFVIRAQRHLTNGLSFNDALESAKQETLILAKQYKEMAQKIPRWEGRAEILIAGLTECVDQIEDTIDHEVRSIEKAPHRLKKPSKDVIKPPYAWDMRVGVFKQMVDKMISLAPNSPYFLALQEVTPQALNDLKAALANRNLRWISFNNLSGQEPLPPQREEVLGESTGFTSTMALSPDLEVLKIELGDLPTESGSVRKILGVKVRHARTGEVYNLFTTHTDHKVQNDIYARTAEKIHLFATHFFDESLDGERFVMGGDLNALEEVGGDKYLERLYDLFTGSRDFRETAYYAPHPVAWSSFIGRGDDTYSGHIAKEGTVKPNALDHIIVGGGIELESAGREALVYDESGQLLDYYVERNEYMMSLEKRFTFSDHFFNIVRFK